MQLRLRLRLRLSPMKTPFQDRNYGRQVIMAGWFLELEKEPRGAGYRLVSGQQLISLLGSCMSSRPSALIS